MLEVRYSRTGASCLTLRLRLDRCAPTVRRSVLKSSNESQSRLTDLRDSINAVVWHSAFAAFCSFWSLRSSTVDPILAWHISQIMSRPMLRHYVTVAIRSTLSSGLYSPAPTTCPSVLIVVHRPGGPTSCIRSMIAWFRDVIVLILQL